MSLRTPLGRVKGLGSAKDGTHHFWVQRVSAVALIPLTLWFLLSLVTGLQLEYQAFVAWAKMPVNTLLLSLFVLVGIYHFRLGLQVVIEDYIHGKALLVTLQLANTCGCFLLAAASLLSLLKVALGA